MWHKCPPSKRVFRLGISYLVKDIILESKNVPLIPLDYNFSPSYMYFWSNRHETHGLIVVWKDGGVGSGSMT